MPRLAACFASFAAALLLTCAACGSMAATLAPMSAAAAKPSAALDAAVAGVWRDPKNSARDAYRHPSRTLAFFGVAPQQTVVEITPGAGWYSEILAPYLRDQGQYIAAVVDPASETSDRGRASQLKTKMDLEAKFAAAPAQYAHARVVAFDPKAPRFGAARSADVVLTFRNVHNWRSQGHAEAMFKGFFDVLKPGGVLGVVEHRAKHDVPADDQTGYVGQQQVIAMARAAGFVLAGKNEINANPKDTTVHPNGVWTLPPVNRHDPEDGTKYAAIGESDRMTLRFVKPAR